MAWILPGWKLTATLAVAMLAHAGGQAQESASGNRPDPAAVLLAPVATEVSQPIRSSADYDLPPRPNDMIAPVGGQEHAATLQGQGRVITADDFEQFTRQRSEYTPPSGARTEQDPYDYLMGESFQRESKQIGDRYNDQTFGDRFRDRLDQLFGQNDGLLNNQRMFSSDHAFDNFISPVTNPFYFEDPRSLTELRPLLIYQSIPGGQPLFQGGSAWFVGTQARLALTERWSLVLNKVGFQAFNPANASRVRDSFGLSELHIGPKVTLIRDPEFKTLVAAGATFQIPIGSSRAFQDTGSLSIVPYVSAAQKLLSTQLGTFNGMASGGYSFSIDKQRSDFFFASAHIDFDLGNKGRFYPFVEANWFVYTTDGETRDFGVEARDLANFGANASGSNLATIALGGKFKPASNRFEFGGAFELPLIGNKDLFRYRFTVDFIWRY